VRKGECVTNLFMLSALLVLSFPARCVCTVCGCQLMGRLPVLQATRGPKGWMRNLFDVLELPDSKKIIKAEALKAVASVVEKDPGLMDLQVCACVGITGYSVSL
jgi:hypothetical protein